MHLCFEISEADLELQDCPLLLDNLDLLNNLDLDDDLYFGPDLLDFPDDESVAESCAEQSTPAFPSPSLCIATSVFGEQDSDDLQESPRSGNDSPRSGNESTYLAHGAPCLITCVDAVPFAAESCSTPAATPAPLCIMSVFGEYEFDPEQSPGSGKESTVSWPTPREDTIIRKVFWTSSSPNDVVAKQCVEGRADQSNAPRTYQSRSSTVWSTVAAAVALREIPPLTQDQRLKKHRRAIAKTRLKAKRLRKRMGLSQPTIYKRRTAVAMRRPRKKGRFVKRKSLWKSVTEF